MTKTLIFYNPGEIDIRGATIAGLSAKTSDSPIGFFGTGLKYAIACVLRWNGSVTIYSGTKQYRFATDKLDFRGHEFQQITMVELGSEPVNKVELGFTTEYGKNWEPWQVFRELYANARDEGGGVRLAEPTHPAQHAWTHILVSGVPELITAYYERDDIILPADKTWQQQTAKLQFSSSPAAAVYYRGVRVLKHKCHYTWNILTKTKLTEDRTISSYMDIDARIRSFLINDCTDEAVIENMLKLWHTGSKSDNSFESEAMTFFAARQLRKNSCSAAFQRTICRLYRHDPVSWRCFRHLAIECEPDLAAIGAHKLSPREETMLAKAKELVALFGFESEVATIPIEIRDLGPKTLGICADGRIGLSPQLFNQGTKQLVATLYEECFHARTEHSDLTYNMQNELFNIIISLLEDKHGVIC